MTPPSEPAPSLRPVEERIDAFVAPVSEAAAHVRGLIEAADQVRAEARWQEFERQRGHAMTAEQSIERLLMIEEILRHAAARAAQEAGR